MKMMGIDDYAENTAPFFAANSFYEIETARRIDVFGNMAHVWSNYEARTSLDDFTERRPPRHQFDPALPTSRRGLEDHLDDLGQRALAEGEGEGVDAGIEEFDAERALADLALLSAPADRASARDHARSVRLHVDARIRSRRLAVDRARGTAPACRSPTEHQVQVARAEADRRSSLRRQR